MKEKTARLFFVLLPVIIFFAVFITSSNLIIQSFSVSSNSMEPTLKPGDKVIVAKSYYRFFKLETGDIIVFNDPLESSGYSLMKRVVGVPGTVIKIKSGQLFINYRRTREPYIIVDSNKESNYGPEVVPSEKVFVMGDNRAASRDSRYFGSIGKENIIGRAVFIYWPLLRIGRLS